MSSNFSRMGAASGIRYRVPLAVFLVLAVGHLLAPHLRIVWRSLSMVALDERIPPPTHTPGDPD